MKRYALSIAVGLLVGGGIAECGARREAGAANQRLAQSAHTRDSLKARLAEAILTQAPARVDTVRQIVTSVKTLRDSVMVHKTDTLLLERFVYRVDSLRAECLRCAALLDTIQERYGAEKRATESYISLLQGEVGRMRAAAKRQSLTSRVGLFVGYGAVKTGSHVQAGPMVGVGVRFFP